MGFKALQYEEGGAVGNTGSGEGVSEAEGAKLLTGAPSSACYFRHRPS